MVREIARVEANRAKWQRFQNGERLSPDEVSPHILKSWERSRNYGVDPYGSTVPSVSPSNLHELLMQNKDLIASATLMVGKIHNSLQAAQSVISIADTSGIILCKHWMGSEHCIVLQPIVRQARMARRQRLHNAYSGGKRHREGTAGTRHSQRQPFYSRSKRCRLPGRLMPPPFASSGSGGHPAFADPARPWGKYSCRYGLSWHFKTCFL